MATVGSTNGTPSRSAANRMPISGERRFFSMSNASARNGEMYSTCVRALGSTGVADGVTRRSRLERNAVRVLPLPVGAQTSVCCPLRMAGQPWICGGVGVGNDAANHSRTAGEKPSSTGWSAMRAGYARGVTRRPGRGRAETGWTGVRRLQVAASRQCHLLSARVTTSPAHTGSDRRRSCRRGGESCAPAPPETGRNQSRLTRLRRRGRRRRTIRTVGGGGHPHPTR